MARGARCARRAKCEVRGARAQQQLLPAILAVLGGTLFGLHGTLQFYLVQHEHSAASTGYQQAQSFTTTLKQQALAEHRQNEHAPNITRDSLEDDCFGLGCAECLRPGRVGTAPDGIQKQCGWQSDGLPEPGYCRAGAISTQAECRLYAAHCHSSASVLPMPSWSLGWDQQLLARLNWNPCVPRDYRGSPGPDPCGCTEGYGWSEVTASGVAGCAQGALTDQREAYSCRRAGQNGQAVAMAPPSDGSNGENMWQKCLCSQADCTNFMCLCEQYEAHDCTHACCCPINDDGQAVCRPDFAATRASDHPGYFNFASRQQSEPALRAAWRYRLEMAPLKEAADWLQSASCLMMLYPLLELHSRLTYRGERQTENELTMLALMSAGLVLPALDQLMGQGVDSEAAWSAGYFRLTWFDLKALEISYQVASAHGLWLYTLDYLCLAGGFYLLADVAARTERHARDQKEGGSSNLPATETAPSGQQQTHGAVAVTDVMPWLGRRQQQLCYGIAGSMFCMFVFRAFRISISGSFVTLELIATGACQLCMRLLQALFLLRGWNLVQCRCSGAHRWNMLIFRSDNASCDRRTGTRLVGLAGLGFAQTPCRDLITAKLSCS
eukprot:SAG31_NODE_3745_length_3929_cov_2.044125_5_plen_610_part_00